MKLMDFDGLFDEKLTQYMEENKNKYSEKQWENVIPKLYKKFGDTHIAKLGCTPKEYYQRMTDAELTETLSAHLLEDVPVPEFLINEMEKRDVTDRLLPFLDGEDFEMMAYVINVIGDDSRAFERYLSILKNEDADEDLKGDVLSVLCDHADEVKTRVLEEYPNGIEEEFALEILCHVTMRDEAVYQILIKAFSDAEDWQLALRAGYIAAYGDERALPVLFRKIEDKSIGFVEFQELKYAIEALGGEYDEERDFSADKDYLTVEAAKEKTIELENK